MKKARNLTLIFMCVIMAFACVFTGGCATEKNDKDKLYVGMECGYEPYNYTRLTEADGAVKISNAAGYANGYDVQIAKYIAAELGMQLEIVPNKWESLIPAVQSGSVDGIIAGMSPTDERREQVDFSDCYYRSNLVIIYKK